MRRLLPLLSCALLAPLLAAEIASAAAFTSGNVVLYRVGPPAAGALTSAATPVFLDEYSSTGLVQSVAVDSAGATAVTASGTATSEGLISRSQNGQFVLFTGYRANAGTAGVAGTTSATVPRVVGRADASGALDVSTALNAYSGNNIRSAASVDGTSIYTGGPGPGILLTTLGSTGTSFTPISALNTRQVGIFDNQLYASSGSAPTGVKTVGSGLPTTGGQTGTNLPGTSQPSPYQFVLLDLDAGVAGNDTLFVADDTADTIQKYSLVGGTFVSNGTVPAVDARGLTATVAGSTVTVFATNLANRLSTIDGGDYNTAFAGTTTTVATAGANQAFRGLAPTPVAAVVAPQNCGDAGAIQLGDGNDTFVGTPADEVICGGGGTDFIRGGGGNDRIFGEGGNDTLLGEDGDDRLDGAAGNDVLGGEDGDDEFVGGTGTDRVSFADQTAPVTATLPAIGQPASTGNGPTGQNDTLASDIEDLRGGPADDVLTGNDAGNLLDGQNSTTGDELSGLDGADRLRSGNGNDTQDGGAGADSLQGGLGNDELAGGIGDDTLLADAGDDTLDGGGGTGDTASFATALSALNITLAAAAGTGNDQDGLGGTDDVFAAEVVVGGSSGDTITGSGADETLQGNGGNDILDGAAGIDQLFGSSGADRLTGTETGEGVNPDRLDCGSQADVALVDGADSARGNCETIVQGNL